MSGPALRQRQSHNAIHESAFGEAEELTVTLESLLSHRDFDRAVKLIPVIIEHWSTRTLQHAKEEEQGLYLELEKSAAGKGPLIIALKRDHQLLKLLVSEVQCLLRNLAVSVNERDREGMFGEILDRCKTLLWVNQIHSRTEEEELL